MPETATTTTPEDGTGDSTDTMAEGTMTDDASATGDGDGDTTTTGDGDADTATSGDGDGDTTTGDGDGDTTTTGDGDTTTTGDGDGDGEGDTTTTGDGDGDGSTTGDGDGDTTTTGDGDGDGSTTGDGDGDGTTTGDGDGDGDPCGDAMIDVGEECDGANLNGLSLCNELDAVYNGGSLACALDCLYDISACTSIPNPAQVCNSTPLAIPDSPGGPVTSSISGLVGTTAATITDVDVTVTMTHTWIGDLNFAVTHANQPLTLFSQTCGSDDNLNVVFSDEGTGLVCGSPVQGTYQPQGGSLSTFDGHSLNGNWVLSVQDNTGGDTGTLTNWCVNATWALP